MLRWSCTQASDIRKNDEKLGAAAHHSGASSAQPIKITRDNGVAPLQSGARRGSTPQHRKTLHQRTCLSAFVSLASHGCAIPAVHSHSPKPLFEPSHGENGSAAGEKRA